ncbi:MAG: cation:proton antiporter [Bacteroidota bacterium]
MENISAFTILFLFCGLIILSYFFSVLHRMTRIPSVLLLLGAGILLRFFTTRWGLAFQFPPMMIELLGTVGLIMIVLEAGLDLELSRARIPLIKSSLLSAVVIFFISSIGIATIIYFRLPGASVMSCLAYAIPLSIVSSAVVFPSVQNLQAETREFLVYEVSFADVIGIMTFNFITADQVIGFHAFTWFLGSIPVALILSVGVCFGLMILLVRNQINIRFFLVFAVLIVTYIGGKMMHLPSLITILMFGLVVNNWELVTWKPLQGYFPAEGVTEMRRFLKSITAESSFLIRTFFFIIFGFGINLSFLQNTEVLLTGGAIVLALLAVRFIYLRIVHRYNLFPELFYIPRGLITVLLFYKIPDWQRIETFDEGILFFVILGTSLIMMFGSILYPDKPVNVETVGISEEEYN